MEKKNIYIWNPFKITTPLTQSSVPILVSRVLFINFLLFFCLNLDFPFHSLLISKNSMSELSILFFDRLIFFFKKKSIARLKFWLDISSTKNLSGALLSFTVWMTTHFYYLFIQWSCFFTESFNQPSANLITCKIIVN